VVSIIAPDTGLPTGEVRPAEPSEQQPYLTIRAPGPRVTFGVVLAGVTESDEVGCLPARQGVEVFRNGIRQIVAQNRNEDSRGI
jgi:hypothetical protein